MTKESKKLEQLSLMDLMGAIAFCTAESGVEISSEVCQILEDEGIDNPGAAIHMIPYLCDLVSDKVNNGEIPRLQ